MRDIEYVNDSGIKNTKKTKMNTRSVVIHVASLNLHGSGTAKEFTLGVTDNFAPVF